MRRLSPAFLAILPLTLGALPAAAGPGQSVEIEELHYRWRLTGVTGFIAGLFFPRTGDGSLTSRPAGVEGRVSSELLITSQEGETSDFWRYGAELDPTTGSTTKAWSSYRFRGRARAEEAAVEQRGVVDVASGIYLLRRSPPQRPTRMQIWSDGHLYPVLVLPGETRTRRLRGRPVSVRCYTIQGLEIEGERLWKGKLILWLADDPAATPVEIHVERGWADVKLTLIAGAGDKPAAAQAPGEPN